MLKCVMLDWGGTLSDQSASILENNRKAVFPFWKELGFKGGFKEFKKMDEKTTKELWKIWRKNKKFKRYDWSFLFAKNAGLRISEKYAKKEFEIFFNYYIKYSKLYPETKDILSFIKKSDLISVLISNNWKEAYKAFEKCSVMQYFDFIILSEEVNALKSHLKPFKIVLKKFNLKPERCLMVGNDLVEDGACRKLGIKFCLVDRDRKHKMDFENFDYKIENLEELKDIINELLK